MLVRAHTESMRVLQSIVDLNMNLKSLLHSRGRRKEKKTEETVNGLKCQRYDYFPISLNETHLAGLVSHSQWDPEVKRGSNQD